ncbi:hypothetical protein SAMN06265379_102155 [Saccharicrinis carchari]|uniref:DUF4369 domain-containing protein n=1 Tax=Saccharicrinis carchari TaxID=1168039 RepID=A0A521BWT5_SACCC|nr:hypothetical protein [Saccharicrinis carchari]SMO51639.1 hypothetical protein SAMN06265379_102155 [Saccharicrinis carchari]
MKKIKHILIGALIILMGSCTQEQEQQIPLIEGLISNFRQTNVFLYSDEAPAVALDTIEVDIQGFFSVPQRSIQGAGFYFLTLNDSDRVNLFLKPDDYINLQIDANNVSASCRSNNSKFMMALWALERNNAEFKAAMEKLSHEFDAMSGKPYNKRLYEKMYSLKDSLCTFYKNKSIAIAKEVNSPVIDFFMLNQKAGNIAQFSLQSDSTLFLNNAEQLSDNPQLKKLFQQYDNDITKAYSEK